MAQLNKMSGFKVYNGTKADFIAAGFATTHADAIVFIKGGADAKGSCIYAQGMYFANFAEFLSAINYVKGIVVGDTTYNAASGGGYVGFGASDPATLSVDVQNGKVTVGLSEAFVTKVNNTASNLGSASDTAKADGSAFARIAQLASDLASLTGSSSGSIADQIAALKQAIEGDLSDADAKTLEAINNELDAIDTKWASYVSKDELSVIGGDEADGDKVNVKVTTLGGKVTAVKVNESGLTAALDSKADASAVYTKGEADAMAQDKVDTLAKGTVKANTEAIATLNGGIDTEGSVDKKIRDAINAFAGSADNDNVIENVTELLAYVSGVDGSKTLAAALADIETNKAAIGTLKGDDETVGSVAKAIADEVARAEAAYAVKGTEGVASGAAARAEEAYRLAEQKVDAAGAKAQAQAAISEITEVTKEDTDNAYVQVTVKTKAGSVSSVVVDDARVKVYADQVAETAKSEAIAATTESLKSYYTKAEVDAMWLWEEL